jgi:hypothetical protein
MENNSENSKNSEKNNQRININKAILDVGLLLFGGPEPV